MLQRTGSSEDPDKASAAHAGGGMTKGGEKEEENTRSESWRRLADTLSDSEVRGDDCIDGFYFQVVAVERKKVLEELVMQRGAINQHSQFAANENQIKAAMIFECLDNFQINSVFACSANKSPA